MAFGVFTDNWEWFFAVLAVVVVIVALLRYLFGRPKLEFRFCVDAEVVDGDKQQNLDCELRNSPKRSFLMKMLQVPRPRVDNIIVHCEVADKSSEMRSIGRPFPVDITDADGKTSKQLSLPASSLPVNFTVLTYSISSDMAWLNNNRDDDIILGTEILYSIRAVATIGDKNVQSQLGGCVISNHKITHIQSLPRLAG